MKFTMPEKGRDWDSLAAEMHERAGADVQYAACVDARIKNMVVSTDKHIDIVFDKQCFELRVVYDLALPPLCERPLREMTEHDPGCELRSVLSQDRVEKLALCAR